MRTLLIATHNPGKAREYRSLLSELPLKVLHLDELGITEEVEETGATLAENAAIKATHFAQVTGFWTWADDSGLEVDALDGAPGVHSARFAGPAATDADRYRRPRPAQARRDLRRRVLLAADLDPHVAVDLPHPVDADGRP